MPAVLAQTLRLPDAPPPEAQRRLLLLRALLVLMEAGGIVLLDGPLGARLPVAELAGILSLHAALDGVAWLRMRTGRLAAWELLLHLAVDASAIAALVYLTGGYANPFISLLLVPLILAAVTLPTAHAWAMAVWVGLLYTLLVRFFVPLELGVSDATAISLHLGGMWLNFLLTTTLVAASAGRLAAALRRRDAELAADRERRLRDEQLFALGLQAASAAHDLATPMASLRLTLDDLGRDYAGDEELAPSLARLSSQLARMERVLARLAEAARRRGDDVAGSEALDGWLGRVLEHWGLLWPQARLRFQTRGAMPNIHAHGALEAALVTLLNNAAQAGPGEILVDAYQHAGRVVVRIVDQGPGPGATAKTPGWGVGLDLARAGVERLGGRVEVSSDPGGGLEARLEFPLSEVGP